jgi:hypothetical protein
MPTWFLAPIAGLKLQTLNILKELVSRELLLVNQNDGIGRLQIKISNFKAGSRRDTNLVSNLPEYLHFQEKPGNVVTFFFILSVPARIIDSAPFEFRLELAKKSKSK